MNEKIQIAVNNKALISAQIKKLKSEIEVLEMQKSAQVVRIIKVIRQEIGSDAQIMFSFFDTVMVDGFLYEPPR